MRRKICIITGSRAEYGLLKPLINRIKSDKTMQLQVIVTAAHLSPEFGLTIKQIEEDRIPVNEKIDVLLSSNTAVGIAKSMGLAMIGLSESLDRLKPDLIVLLGDRFEILSAASTALVLKIPIAHLHGGETTEGAYDESIRHAITKLSHLHFTSTELYRKRVIQLGENPKHVFNVGAIGLDNIRSLRFMSRNRVEKSLGITFLRKNLLITFHPETMAEISIEKQCHEVLDAVSKMEDTLLVFTKANSDTGGRIINETIKMFVSVHKNAFLFDSLGQLRYLSLLRWCDAIVGNSSSGIIEAPSLKISTVNIGNRQKGRIKAASIIDCPCSSRKIVTAINMALSDEFRQKVLTVFNPYGDGRTSGRIIKILKKGQLFVKKPFFDMKNI